MPRWESGTRDRLERAALRLFAEQGYPGVTAVRIAEEAGVTKATFFRVFPDKREVLFWGQDLIAQRFAEGVAEAPDGSGAAALVVAGLERVAPTFPDDRHDLAALRRRVVDAEPELRERLAAKRAALRDALERALRARGVPADEAAVAADLGRAAYSRAYARWAEAAEPPDFAALAREELAALLEAAVRLGRGPG